MSNETSSLSGLSGTKFDWVSSRGLTLPSTGAILLAAGDIQIGGGVTNGVSGTEVSIPNFSGTTEDSLGVSGIMSMISFLFALYFILAKGVSYITSYELLKSDVSSSHASSTRFRLDPDCCTTEVSSSETVKSRN